MSNGGGGGWLWSCGGQESGNKVFAFFANKLICYEKFFLPNCYPNYKLISIQLFITIYVENGYCIGKLSNILKSEVDTSNGGGGGPRKVCGGS